VIKRDIQIIIEYRRIGRPLEDREAEMLEIVVETVQDAIAAEKGGADRLDLKSSFILKGLTPSAGMIEEICSRVALDVMVMIRPHVRSWVVSPDDLAVMAADIRLARSLGASGFLLGALSEDKQIDTAVVRSLAEAAEGLPLHFHMGWEMSTDPIAELEQAIDLGIHSLRTSGGAGPEGSAATNLELICSFREYASGRIELLLAGGVTIENVGVLVKKSGVTNIHSGSAVRSPVKPQGAVDASKVAKLRAKLDQALSTLPQSS
jgi:copper homeostasis protein